MKKSSKVDQYSRVKAFFLFTFLFFIVLVIFSLWGGLNHLTFITKPAPDLGAAAFQNDRTKASNQQAEILGSLDLVFGGVIIGRGHVDVCVHGFEGGLGKPGTQYAHRCVYRSNQFYVSNMDFEDALTRIGTQLEATGWNVSSNSFRYILSEYVSRLKTDRDVVNGLLGLGYYKNNISLDVGYADFGSGQDSRLVAFTQLDESNQMISNQIIGERIYEDEQFIDHYQAMRTAIDKQYRYVLVVGAESIYFEN